MPRMSQRNFLRRQVIEYKELDGLKKGFRVFAIVDNQPEQGTVKWIGTIKGTMYIGIQFERPVGNLFPETKGAAPFPCLIAHTRLVFPEDVKIKINANEEKARPRKTLIMEQEEEQKNLTRTLPEFQQMDSSQDEDNYCLLQKVSCLCLGEEDCPSDSAKVNVCVRAGDTECKCDGCGAQRFVIMSHHQYQQTDPNINNDNYHENDYVNVNFCRGEYDSEFMSPSATSSSSVSPLLYGNNGGSVLDDEKLSTFHRLCSQTRRLIKEYQVKFEELPTLLARLESDLPAANLNLEKLKSFQSEVDDCLGELLERCKLNMETVLRYSDIVLPPSDERKMTKEIHELEQAVAALDQDICGEIKALEDFNIAHQNLQECLQERLSRFTAIKTRLVQVERNLVKDESGLSLRLKGIQSILSVLDRDHREETGHDTEKSESSDIRKLLAQIRPYDYVVDITRVVSQTQDLIQSEKQLLDEVKVKRTLLLDAKESYSKFLRRLENFHVWYDDYMRRLGETKVTGPEFDVMYPSLVTEREDKRKEFIEILALARNLRASIFDSSAVDNKIEELQNKWKGLVEKVYRARSRKTV